MWVLIKYCMFLHTVKHIEVPLLNTCNNGTVFILLLSLQTSRSPPLHQQSQYLGSCTFCPIQVFMSLYVWRIQLTSSIRSLDLTKNKNGCFLELCILSLMYCRCLFQVNSFLLVFFVLFCFYCGIFSLSICVQLTKCLWCCPHKLFISISLLNYCNKKN